MNIGNGVERHRGRRPTKRRSVRAPETRHPGGRPTKRTPAITKRIAEAISFGLTDEDAAALVKIDDLTLTRWRKIPEFCRAIKCAVATRKLARLQRIEAGEPGWQGSAWSIERQDPKRFAPPQVQLSQQMSVTKNDNLFIWTQQHTALPAPKGNDTSAPLELEDIEFFCEGEI